MRNSVWAKSADIGGFEKLTEDKKTDVLIIGGGICGILCAYFLQQAGVNYILAEGGRIGMGITKNTTAKITSQHGLIYDKLIKREGTEKARMYLEANETAISMFRELCESTDCDFETKDAYTYTLSDRRKIEDEVEAVNKLGLNAKLSEELPLPFKTLGAIRFTNQAQFNPLKFIAGICGELNIYENTFIKEITGDTAISDCGKITAEKIIVTTHFPFINKHGSYFLKLYQHRSYVSAFENAQELYGMFVDEADKGMSFRNYNGLLLMGGGGHRTGKQGGGRQELISFAKEYYPEAREKYHWATQDCMSLDGTAYIGRYSKQTPSLYVASGFNKWGMTTSMTAAVLLTDMVVGRKNELEEVYSPHRSMLKTQLFVNGLEATVNLLTPTTRRCPHLGCALKWNKAEHTWDCPCHGSRFGRNGELIDNPATGGANVK